MTEREAINTLRMMKRADEIMPALMYGQEIDPKVKKHMEERVEAYKVAINALELVEKFKTMNAEGGPAE